ncbi:unnamed protein product [Pedinophyceae sp. YPF-701]|nr:unnamed protein product [Pedinophyceae sp. YPF-701]
MIPSKASLVATGVPVALDLLAGVIFVQHTVAWRRSRVRRPSRPHVWPALAIASAAAWELLLAICESTYFEKLYDAGLALAATAVYAPMAWSLSLGHWGGYLTVALACRLSWIISLRVAWSGVIVVAGIVSDTLGFMNSPYLGLTAAANVSLALAAGLFLGAATTGTQPQTALPTSRSRRGELEAPLLGERAASDAGRDEAEVRDVLFVVDWAMQALASRWLFMSVTPMFSAAQRRQLGPGDMPELRGNLATTECADALWAAWEAEVTRAQKQETSAGGAGRAPEWGKAVEPDACPAMPRGASLLRAMLGAFGGEYWLLGGLKLLGDSLNFAAPMLLHQLVRYMQEVPVEVPERAGGAGAGVPWWLGGALVELGKHGRHKPAWWERWGLTPLELGVAYAVLLGATSLLKAVLNTQYSFRMGAIQCRLRAALTCAVCRKSLLVNVANLSEFSSGGVQTLMSVDADRVVGLALSFHELWSLPLQIVAALFLLWTQVRGAFLAGLALVVLMIPANRWLSTRIGRAAQRMMMAKDRRVRLVTEMVANMKQIRMLGWEAPVASRVQHHRGRELRALSVHKYLDAVCVFFWAATSLAFSVSTFVLYAALGHKLTASAVFTSMVLFNTLIAPLNSFPWVINGVVEAMVSVNRLSHFLRAPECSRSWNLAKAPHAADCGDASRADAGDALPPSRMATLPEVLESVTPPRGGRASPPPYLSKHSAGSTGTVESARIDAEADASPPAPVASFSDASFAWAPGAADGSPPRLVLRDLRLSVPEGALVVVTGPTGSGKSSLLHAVVGELYMESGRRHARGKMALVPEEPWLVRGTIRDNITMHMPYEESKFRAVVRSCALEADLDGFLRGAHETVGDRGVTLSGGQRKRIALARALYSEADTFLIDDILAAVDAKVANWIFEKTILVLLRAGKTVLLCTHTTRPLASADLVVELEAGRVVKVTSSAAAVPWAHASHDSRLEGAVGVSPGGGASSVRLLGTTLPAQYGDWQSMVEAPFAGAPDDDDGSSGDEHLLSLLTPRDGWRPLRMEDVPELSLDAPPSPSPHASPVGSFADASTPLSATPPSRHALPGVPEERPAVPRHIPAPLVLPEAPETERDADEGKILSVSGRVRDSATGAEDRSRTSTMEDLRHAQRRQRRDGTARAASAGSRRSPAGPRGRRVGPYTPTGATAAKAPAPGARAGRCRPPPTLAATPTTAASTRATRTSAAGRRGRSRHSLARARRARSGARPGTCVCASTCSTWRRQAPSCRAACWCRWRSCRPRGTPRTCGCRSG